MKDNCNMQEDCKIANCEGSETHFTLMCVTMNYITSRQTFDKYRIMQMRDDAVAY